MSLALWHWHIEVSSKCTLRCPRCARTEVPDSLINTELDLDFFKKNFTPEFISKHVEKITFCGDDGDPIYAHDLVPIIQYIKSYKDVAIVIVTNGSYKKTDWWLSLANVLTDVDHVHFSLDGYDQFSNEQYRVNSDWDSIMMGVNTLRKNSDCYMTWDSIGFKFNENHIDHMRDMARKLGFDQFQLTLSTKFGSKYEHYGRNDRFEPDNKNLISSTHRFERQITNLSGRLLREEYKETNERLFNDIRVINDIKPICHIGNKGLFINSKGEFYPCCWVANRYGHNKHWNELGKKFNLYENLLSDVVNDMFWNERFIENSYECKLKCTSSVVDKNYATEW
jgi:MoaA/NifB/PqqE/SkfB family radical SAM enzyme